MRLRKSQRYAKANAQFAAWKGTRQTYVVAREVMNWGLGQHAVVFELTLAKRRSVSSDYDQLGLARSQALQRRLVAEGDFASKLVYETSGT